MYLYNLLDYWKIEVLWNVELASGCGEIIICNIFFMVRKFV